MKKGLIFIVLAAMLYWGYFYIMKMRIVPQKPLITGEEIIAPVRKAEKMVRKANLGVIETSIEIFRHNEGRFPRDLQELVKEGYFSKLPDSGDTIWEYNQQDGSIK